MKDIEPSNISGSGSNPDDPRLGQLLAAKPADPKVVLLGFPSDEGVKRNGGRPGAATAPDKIRKALFKLTPDAREPEPIINLLGNAGDIGNVKVTGDLDADQQRLGRSIGDYLKQGVIPVILGGGHGTAYGHFRGYIDAGYHTSIFNLDAHTDVRPLKNGKSHSGSPFRQAIEHESGCYKKYTVMGLQPHSVAKAHRRFIEKHGGEAIFKGQTTLQTITNQLDSLNGRCMVTFDMDAVDQAFAPGVSAPCTHGLKPDLWLKAAYQAGKNKQVTSFDLSEVNPAYDRDGQTTRLAALTIWYFLKGVSQRH